MSTIRPLATIAVLAALGVFLAYKINEGPTVALNEGWSTEPAAGEAPAAPAWDPSDGSPASVSIEVPASGSSLKARSAPAWADGGQPAAPEAAPAPAFPALPELPPLNESGDSPAFNAVPPVQGKPAGAEIATERGSMPSFPTATNQSLTLPNSIPQANYGGANSTEKQPAITGSVPSLGSSTPSFDAGQTAPVTPNVTFEAAWQSIRQSLERGDLPRAHTMLSQWRADANLSPAQQQQVDQLLGQLAGTVVYSTDHHLEPAHVVTPGETLETVAKQYKVPWQLLAKINGIPEASAIQPGQKLKVVRGPFTAEVDLKRGELVVLLDGRYAGKFPVRVEGTAPGDGAWRVGQKQIANSAVASTAPSVVLESPAGEQMELSSGVTPTPGTRGRLTIASNDLADLYDILSVGSPVTIRR